MSKETENHFSILKIVLNLSIHETSYTLYLGESILSV